ncbi:MAG: sugar ABC transporter permease [Anaerolineae bacterium]|jgi:multiple sugar transport system permease protein|nr:sugar ABC transporter permease [Anaerolineae bacterium]
MASIAVPKRRVSSFQRREWLQGYLFAAPFLIGFFAFVAFPMLFSIWLMFQKWDLLSPPTFVGLANIQRMLTDELARKALVNSAIYTVFAVPFQLVISFSLALALTQPVKLRSLYRAGFYLPIIIPVVATAVVWQRVLHPDFGILNTVLGWVGIPPQPWLLEPGLAKPAFIFMSFWMIGRQMVIFIAGLGNIPVQLQEAAQIDGASKLTSIFKITVPLMTPLIFYNMIIAIINSFQTFVPSLIMTDGGPENSTLFVVLNIYRNGFQFFNMGYASALAWELFVIVIGLTIAQFYVSSRWVYYES